MLYEIPEQHRLLSGRSLSGRTPIEHQHLDALITALAAFSGILTETMVRGQSVALIGRRLERALGLSATLRATLLCGPSAAPEGLRLEATLRARASLITYPRRYQPVPDLPGR